MPGPYKHEIVAYSTQGKLFRRRNYTNRRHGHKADNYLRIILQMNGLTKTAPAMVQVAYP